MPLQPHHKEPARVGSQETTVPVSAKTRAQSHGAHQPVRHKVGHWRGVQALTGYSGKQAYLPLEGLRPAESGAESKGPWDWLSSGQLGQQGTLSVYQYCTHRSLPATQQRPLQRKKGLEKSVRWDERGGNFFQEKIEVIRNEKLKSNLPLTAFLVT